MSRPGLQHRVSTFTAAKTVVLISGANTGIGYEIAKKLAVEQPKYQILLGCRSVEKGEEAAARMGALVNVNPIQLDLSNDQSIEHCFLTIEQMFGKLDVLINNAGTAGRDVDHGDPHGEGEHSQSKKLRQLYTHVFNINVTGTAVLTEKMVPLLEKARVPRIIFISSSLGSIQQVLNGGALIPVPYYNSSKSAVNMLAAYYAKKHPNWKVNSCCPGLRATGLNGAELNEKTDPALGAVNAVRLATIGEGGPSGTYSNTEGPLPW